MKYNIPKPSINPYEFPKGTKLISYKVISSLRCDWLRITYKLPGENKIRSTNYGHYDKRNGKWPIRASLTALIRGLTS